MKKRSWSEEDLIVACKESFSIRTVLLKLNLVPAGGNYTTIHSAVKKLNLDTSHWTGCGHLKGKTHTWSKKASLKEICVSGRETNSYKLKHRLLLEKKLENKCQGNECQITNTWLSKPLALHLDHINGDRLDNRLENLRLLCPNCHSQTITYCGKNKKSRKPTTP